MKTTMDDIIADLSKQQAEAAKNSAITIGSITDLLAISGVESVEIFFDGAGDSGSIENIEPVGGTISDDMLKKIEDWAYEVLEGTDVDWYNNDGGYGDIIIDVKKRTYRFEVNVRHTVSETEAEGTVKIPKTKIAK